MNRGSLQARVTRLEGTEAGVCQVCQGRSGPIGVYVEGEDGIRREADGRPMPAGDPGWTCAGCGRYYARTPIVILVEGRSKSLRRAVRQAAPRDARG
jgi:hypothetical protein